MSSTMAMGIPDFWFKQIEVKDDDWNMNALWHELNFLQCAVIILLNYPRLKSRDSIEVLSDRTFSCFIDMEIFI
ncbi:MAG: hypothetical protein JJE18_08215 [Eubacteriaceae bacterium]|nr:hypothetical protein [Eubacteriaceae bacterium]